MLRPWGPCHLFQLRLKQRRQLTGSWAGWVAPARSLVLGSGQQQSSVSLQLWQPHALGTWRGGGALSFEQGLRAGHPSRSWARSGPRAPRPSCRRAGPARSCPRGPGRPVLSCPVLSCPSGQLRRWRQALCWSGRGCREPGAVNEFLNKLSTDTSLKISMLTRTHIFGTAN